MSTPQTPISDSRKRGRVTIGFLCIGIVALLFLLLINRPRDEFEFLKGHAMTTSGVAEGRTRGFEECRIYSWAQDYKAFDERATKEMIFRGFVLKTQRPTWKEFRGTDGRYVEWENCRTDVAPECRPQKKDRRYVTVIVGKSIPDDWIGHVRYALTTCHE